MEKFFRFAARRPRLSRFLVTLFPTFPLAFVLIWNEVPEPVTFSIIALILFVFYGGITLSVMFLMNPKVQFLNLKCDPIPLRDITAFLLTCPLSPAHRIVTSMNHAVALRELGAFEEAMKVMEAIDFTRPRKIPPMVKFVYLHNCADFCHHTGRTVEADTFHARAMELWDHLPQRLRKPALENTVHLSRAFAHFRHGEYSDAIDILRDMTCTHPRQEVERSLLMGRCALTLGQTQEAGAHLNHVICHGNRLHMVSQAAALLENLDRS